MVEIQVIVIYPGSEMCSNRKWIFSADMPLALAEGRNFEPDTSMIGDQLRENLLYPPLGNWHVSSWMMGETVPLEKNHVRLHKELKDKYGIPQLIISCEWSENDDKMVEDYIQETKEMFERRDLSI